MCWSDGHPDSLGLSGLSHMAAQQTTPTPRQQANTHENVVLLIAWRAVQYLVHSAAEVINAHKATC